MLRSSFPIFCKKAYAAKAKTPAAQDTLIISRFAEKSKKKNAGRLLYCTKATDRLLTLLYIITSKM
jgi:hypothetical protein